MKRLNLKFTQSHLVGLVSLMVGIYGAFVIATTLLDQFTVHRHHFLNGLIIDSHLLLGLGVVYLSILLSRRKRNAMFLAIAAFAFLLGEGITELIELPIDRNFSSTLIWRYIVLPLFVMCAILLTRNEFKVRSDESAFRNSIKIALLVLVVTLAYGVGGFMLMDKSDFHQEIGFTSAIHRTIDQFDLTTNAPLHPYTRRAKLFMDSLSFVSTAAVVYLVISLFQPVKSRLSDQSEARERMKQLLDHYGAPSEDFFKLWPHDKHYFFVSSGDAALAYSAKRGVALILADPIGNKASYAKLFNEFQDMCWANDWQLALIHIDDRFKEFYKDQGFQLQLVGQEAFVDIEHFISVTSRNKYFRNIKNRFNRENYTVEIIDPPHHQAVISRLKVISDDWLTKPGRTERGFVMGYFSEDYLQQCRLVVVRDAAKTIQSFMNLIPSNSFNKTEATYDMLREAKDSQPNINDFLLYQLIHYLKEEGYLKLSLGMSPLVGLEDSEEEHSLISSVMRFAYVNGDRIYSFSGLHRFKRKYEPAWYDRFVAYKGGVRGFSRMLNGLVAAMKVRRIPLKRQSN